MLFFIKRDADKKDVKTNMAQNWHHYALFFPNLKGTPNENKPNSCKIQISRGMSLESHADFSSNFWLHIKYKQLLLNWHSLQT